MTYFQNKLHYYLIGVILAIVFFAVGVLTISDYGLNIDESIHFIRGQAYLNLLTTGEKRYKTSDLTGSRISGYKLQQYNAAYFTQNDSGHPPLNGILAAASNIIFYEKLGWFGDLEAYHLFEISVSSLLVLLIYVMTRHKYGIFAGLVSSLSLGLYPLFLGESHFNIKDPIEASFFTFTIFFIYLSVEKRNGLYLFFSSIFFALAFGTKFNIVFLPLIILPYLIAKFPSFKFFRLKYLKNIPIGMYLSLILYPIIIFGIQFVSRPYLWTDPVTRFMNIILYYRDIGTGISYQPAYIFNGWNLYAPFFVAISTPLPTLTLFLIGIVYSLFLFRKEKDKFSFLILMWFVVSVFRVMWPGSSIYSGVRQIMEYVPAMAILSGIGANCLIQSLKLKIFNSRLQLLTFSFELLMILLFVPITIKLIAIHPNENVYINQLVGGLRGAMEKKIPGSGETMGNVYLQGVIWLNKYAEKNANFGLPVGLASNIPRQFVRSDIKLGGYFSGTKRDGEYMMEMVSTDFPPPRYNFQYLNTFLNPIYEVKVDQATILKVWKNDIEHTKKGYLNEVEEKEIKVVGGKEIGFIEVKLGKPRFITRLEVDHDNKKCIEQGGGGIAYYDNKEKVHYTPDDLYLSQGRYAASLQTKNHFVYSLPAIKTTRLWIIPKNANLCLMQLAKVSVFVLRDLR